MKNIRNTAIFVGMILGFISCGRPGVSSPEPYPAEGLEAELAQLRRVDLMPQYRKGIVEQISSYDTTGGNDDGFSGRYSHIRKEGRKLVLADLKGPGVIHRIWTPTPTRDTVQFYFDGETAPRISIPFIDLFSGNVYPFVSPVCGNEIGGYYCYIPIPYSRSCKIMYTGEKIQFHQIQYRNYAEDTKPESFPTEWPKSAKAELEKTRRFWETPARLSMLPENAETIEEMQQFSLSPGETVSFFGNTGGGRIVGMELECGSALEGKHKDIIIRAQWDNDTAPAINSPVADFFGYAYGKPAMRSLLIGCDAGVNYCYLPMPFEKKAELKLVYEKRADAPQPEVKLKTKVYYTSAPRNREAEGRLYTVWRREIRPEDGKPYLFADIKDKGHYAGTIHWAQGLEPGMTLFFEGDDSTAVDGKMRIHGTGSEDYYNGGWYALLDRWDRGVSLPLHGSLDYSLPMCRTGGYRFYMTDKMSFDEELTLTMEHGPEGNKFPVDYTSLAFYYGNAPSTARVHPTEALRTVDDPTTHVFFPQLMNVTPRRNTQVENKGRLIMSSEGEGLLRIMLDEVPEGRYKVSLTYYRTPDGASFSFWNRQKMIADWKDAYAPTETVAEKQEIGEINLTRHTNSISVRTKKTDKGTKFHFGNLYLERI